MDSLDTYRFGEVNKMDPDHLKQTACHEAGPALVCRLCGVTPALVRFLSAKPQHIRQKANNLLDFILFPL